MKATSHCLALVQVMDEAVLRARVPAAFARGEAMVRKAIEQLTSQCRGEVATGAARGHLLWFPDPAEAARFGVELVQTLLQEPWPSTLLVRPEAEEQRTSDGTVLFRGLRTRVGIHVGLAVREGDRVRGPGVYQLARWTGAAHGGQIVVSETARGDLPEAGPSYALRDLGAHRVTGVDGARRLFEVVPTSLAARSFPEPFSEGVRRSNLPPEEEFVGRQKDVAAMIELTGMGVRLITVVGAEGYGKSRLIRQFAHVRRAGGTLTGGVWLAAPSTTSVAVVTRALASALQVPLLHARTVEDAVERVGYAISDLGPCLVVLDGLRTADPQVGEALERWLRLAPEARFVVSAPDRLRARGEVAYRVGPMEQPADPADRHADAVRLLAGRGRALTSTFSVGEGETVSRLLDAVEAKPRSIRLLAGVADRMSLEAVDEALQGGAELHDVAWDVLDAGEKAVLAVCAMHWGSFEAVEAPPGAPDVDVHGVLDSLDRRGWLRVAPDPAAPDVRRYALAPGLRAFVRRRMGAEELARVRQHRSRGLVRECERWFAASIRRDEPELVALLSVEWPNLVQLVLDGLRSDGGAPEVGLAMQGLLALDPVLDTRGPTYDGLTLADQVLARCDEILDADPVLQARVLLLRAKLLMRAGRPGNAEQDLARAELIAERWSESGVAPFVALLRGQVEWSERREEAAARSFASAVAGFQAMDDLRMRAIAESYLAGQKMVQGRYEEAESGLDAAIESLRELRASADQARAVRWMALMYSRDARFEESRELYQTVIALQAQEGNPRAESHARTDLAVLDYHLGRLEDAERGLAEAATVARRAGDRGAEARAMGHSGLVALSMGKLDEAKERMVSSLAVRRDLGDSAGEGRVTGLLGVLHHLSDQVDAARGFYLDALRLLDDAGDRRLEGLFGGWLAALEAESRQLDAAREQFTRARSRHDEAPDPQIAEALGQLWGAVQWMEALEAEEEGRDASAESLRDEVRERLKRALAPDATLPGEARLAAARVERLTLR